MQQAIQAAALANLPELLRGAGIMLPYGTVIEGQTVEPLPASQATASTPQAAHPTFRDRMFGRRPSTAQAAPQDAPQGQADADAITAAISGMVARGELVIPVAQQSNNTHSANAPTQHAPGQGQGTERRGKPLGRDAQNPTPRP